MINISEPLTDHLELKNIKKILRTKNFTDAYFQKICEDKISKIIKQKIYLTQSCSHALEISAILLNLKKGDEVLIPSYTFTSTANAVVHRNATPVFVDINKENLCMDLDDLEKKINKKTKAIFIVHYGGNCCDIDKLLNIKKKYNIPIVEDAAHAFLSKYKNKYLGTIGDIGTFSFHETKNFNGGQCGAITINNKKFSNKINLILDKGTDRKNLVDLKKRFLIKTKKYYSWKSLGSEYRASELSAALLDAQLRKIHKIQSIRRSLYQMYQNFFDNLEKKNFYTLKIHKNVTNSYHLFNLVFFKKANADKFKNFMKQKNIASTFHYIPLHNSTFGKKVTNYKKLPITEDIFLKIVRLPLHSNIKKKDVNKIFRALNAYFKNV